MLNMSLRSLYKHFKPKYNLLLLQCGKLFKIEFCPTFCCKNSTVRCGVRYTLNMNFPCSLYVARNRSLLIRISSEHVETCEKYYNMAEFSRHIKRGPPLGICLVFWSTVCCSPTGIWVVSPVGC